MRHEIKPFVEDSEDSELEPSPQKAASSETDTDSQHPESSDDKKISNGKASKLATKAKPGKNKEMKCEVKEYESRYTLKGEKVLKPLGDKNDEDVDTADDAHYAMRYYKYYNREGTLNEVVLKIFSPHILEAFRSVIKTYPNQNVTGQPVILEGASESDTLGCIYHYRAQLEDYVKGLKDVAARLDLQLILKLANKELRRYIERYKVHVENSNDPRVAFTDIWMIFKPGELVFAGKHKTTTERILEVLYTEFSPGGWGSCARWTVVAKCFAHNGKSFGFLAQSFQIDPFKGTKAIERLPVQPLAYHSDVAGLRKRQIARGNKLRTLTGIQHRDHAGEAIAVEHHIKPSYFGGTDEYTEDRVTLTGRIMIDHLAFVKYRKDKGIAFHEDTTLDDDAVTDDDLVLSHCQVPGFALLEKRWCWFRIDNISDIDWDDEAFSLLMLPSGQKRIVRALTWQHTSREDTFDDLIKGKGRGCIFLLHGAPGIGKTFTVESVADRIKKPLYVMMSGELGSDIETVERNLKRVLELVTSWNAVLLIDEADVFLEKRSSQDLARNGLVSIFLRTLEYFSGIMFLTTNRVESFDLAFQSRIHLALKYHPLEANGRAELWKLFLKRTAGFKAQDWAAEVVKEFATVELNGRQIKNTVRTANTLALSESRALCAEDIRVVLETVKEFDADFFEQPQSPFGQPARSLSFGTVGMGKLSLDGPAH